MKSPVPMSCPMIVAPLSPVPSCGRSRHGGWRTLLLAVSVACLTGCSALSGLRENLQYNDAMNDTVLGWRNSVWARQAWKEHQHLHCHEPQLISFGQGFRDGYADVAGGADGCVPNLPPRRFWSWKYQTAEGQAKVAAWFAGYPYGAAAAQQDGAGNHQQLQVSHLIEAQYSPEFQQGICPGCDPATLPGGPQSQTVPRAGQPKPLSQRGPGGPLPLIGPTSQVTPAVQWPQSELLLTSRSQAGASAADESRPAATLGVVPASAQMPVP